MKGRYFKEHGAWHDRVTGRHLHDIAAEVKPSARLLHLMETVAEHDQTPAEAEAELRADGVDVDAFLRSVHAAVDQASVVVDWCWGVVHGSGGFEAYERHELPLFTCSREQAIAEFVVRALANPKCEGSREVLLAIHKKRLGE